MVIPSWRAEAPCSHVVELAKAAVRGHTGVSSAEQDFARVSLQDAERGAHHVFAKYGYTAVSYTHLTLPTKLEV